MESVFVKKIPKSAVPKSRDILVEMKDVSFIRCNTQYNLRNGFSFGLQLANKKESLLFFAFIFTLNFNKIVFNYVLVAKIKCTIVLWCSWLLYYVEYKQNIFQKAMKKPLLYNFYNKVVIVERRSALNTTGTSVT